jgi:hypothetical protein
MAVGITTVGITTVGITAVGITAVGITAVGIMTVGIMTRPHFSGQADKSHIMHPGSSYCLVYELLRQYILGLILVTAISIGQVKDIAAKQAHV